jgi:hypothetical protein
MVAATPSRQRERSNSAEEGTQARGQELSEFSLCSRRRSTGAEILGIPFTAEAYDGARFDCEPRQRGQRMTRGNYSRNFLRQAAYCRSPNIEHEPHHRPISVSFGGKRPDPQAANFHSVAHRSRRNRLNLGTRSLRQPDSVLMCPAPVATVRSPMNVTSASPDLGG